GFKSPR
ncbi:hypothetical protein CICLE_v100091082mg, partial [Citrus x clementina]